MSIVKNVFDKEGIKACRVNTFVTTHGLRDTLATSLFKSGHADFSPAMRIRHRDACSLRSFQYLRRGEGLRQQRDLLPTKDDLPTKRRKIEQDGVSGDSDVSDGGRLNQD